ncbi:hypothetical protein [Archaeoglobus fulgidus]|uniref:Uncharacterized protein n=1 Tax=Archaeoglobus fulgidus DSM 8774 TaxID=1344584 RepID=A0A075W994_ARCFL|nr:hypothetical protein [Archaeoglobus fulgidus]AIG96980.1 hypothetical protein AFULGI_00001440 [Archaeoglobus fulgidus DSM 8774]
MEKSELIVVIIAIVAVVIFLLNFLTPYGYMPMMGYGGGMMGYSDERYYPPGCCQGPAESSSNGGSMITKPSTGACQGGR